MRGRSFAMLAALAVTLVPFPAFASGCYITQRLYQDHVFCDGSALRVFVGSQRVRVPYGAYYPPRSIELAPVQEPCVYYAPPQVGYAYEPAAPVFRRGRPCCRHKR
jgi:hypothetical protein